MGTTYDDLPDHEGYGQAIRADGTPISAGSRAQPVGYTAQCSCGWADSHRHQPTERGYDHAIVTWERHHALPLLATAPPAHITATLNDLRTALAELAHERPAAALRVIDDLTSWTDRLHRQATELAVTRSGPTRREVAGPFPLHGTADRPRSHDHLPPDLHDRGPRLGL